MTTTGHATLHPVAVLESGSVKVTVNSCILGMSVRAAAAGSSSAVLGDAVVLLMVINDVIIPTM